jgi:fumarate reductase flavoprotein subunit
MTEKRIETELLIVGAGGCGLTAALTAAERGVRVLLLEREANPGGSSAMSAGIFVAAESALQRAHGSRGTAQDLADDILRRNEQGSDPAVTLALCRLSGPLMDWLAARGVALEHMAGYRYPGMSHDWLVATPARHGAPIIDALLAAAAQQPTLRMLTNTRATGLLTGEGGVRGVTAVDEGGRALTITARAVILAAAGFGANQDQVARYIPELTGAPYFGGPGASGDAITWGIAAGGTPAGMSAYQTHSSIAFPERILVTTYLINQGAIQVNAHGERFGDETDSYAGHALALQAQPGRSAVELFDGRILEAAQANYQRFQECVDAGLVRRGETVAELAAHFGIDADGTLATVTAYNAAVEKGSDAFGRTQFAAPLRPPYYGIRVTSALVQTLGGLRVDERARVLAADGSPIPGLFAGGGTAVGLAGDRPEGYLAGTGLLTAFGLGWLAGRWALSNG